MCCFITVSAGNKQDPDQLSHKRLQNPDLGGKFTYNLNFKLNLKLCISHAKKITGICENDEWCVVACGVPQ